MTIDEAKAAVRVASENYKSAVHAYRDAIKPTDEEFTKKRIQDFTAWITASSAYEEGVLDQIVEGRE